MLLLLELHLGGGADLEDGHATRQLGEALLELLAVVVGVGVLDFGLDLGDAAGDVAAVAGAFDDGGLVLGDDDLAGLAQHVETDTIELQTDLFTDDLATGEDGHVLQHRLAALTEARCLDRNGGEGATDLVDHERGEGLTLDVLGDDQERAARLHDLLEHRDQLTDVADLGRHEKDVGVVEHGLHALGIGDRVGRDVALVEAHALDEIEFETEGLAFLDRDHAVLADLVDRLGDRGTDLGIGSRDGGDVGDLVLVLGDVLRVLTDRGNGGLDGGLDALLE